jgi:HKD family nuclease
MQITIAENENIKLIDVLSNSFKNAIDLKFSVAFLKFSGLSLIKPDIKSILKNKGKVEFLVGLDFRTTDPNSLYELKTLQGSYTNMKFFCFSKPNKNRFSVFHPKLYIIKNKNGKVTTIVGSSNLTKGGLSKNIELNIIFNGAETESEILQLMNFYLKMRLQETVFEPSYEYIKDYEKIYKKVLTYQEKVFIEKETIAEIRRLQEVEEMLPGTRPTLRRLVVDAAKKLPKTNDGYVHLQDIYEHVKNELKKYGVDFSSVVSIDANIRRAIYGDLVNWKGKYNRGYFERKSSYSGLFRLTDAGVNFKGR